MNATLAELRADLDDRISAAEISGFWKVAAKNRWLNEAGQRVCDFKRWKELELALNTQSRDQKGYYDYPVQFKRNSIFQIEIEGEEYPEGVTGRVRTPWNEFAKAKQNDSETLRFASHENFWFLHPVPPDEKVISIYGLRDWKRLSENQDESILPAEFNEPIVRLALATCLRKAKQYGEAAAERNDILDPNTGVLQLLWEQQNDEAPLGYVGRAKSSRWN